MENQRLKLTKIKSFKKGDTIVREGEKDSGIYYIKSGIARNIKSNIIYGDSDDSNHRFFGFLGSINNERTSTVVADTDVEALIIDFSIIDQNDSLYTIVNDVLKECIEIITNNEKMIKSLEKENRELKQRLNILE